MRDFPEFDQSGQYSINNLNDVSPMFLGDLMAWIEANPPKIPASQITGFNQYQPLAAPTIATIQSTTSTTYTALTTAGPLLTAIEPATYLISFGCSAFGANAARMNIMIDGVTLDPADTNYCSRDGSSPGNISTTFQADVKSSLTARYLSTVGGSVSFGNRWLTATKMSN